ncbi:hypothetical protein PRIPAC_78474 [Pristionchus pacificus]|uniref:G protein-coupled receptor n=1 Tax=Pristionchus pacificus TaxID=54126 RepID=A0A2A6CME0_PRIPA|nr:hypothetical protein PRIPAC_78474 [Pristionchus pacificus]|eukprot:PDM79260.1 G protein-coupled receptor [Pristionchus pacificus]
MAGVESGPIVHSPDTEQLYIVGTYWANGTFYGARWKSFGGAVVLATGMVTFYVTIAICSYLIVNHMRTTAMSASTIRLQRQLFKCLVYQTVFPTLTAYFPASFCTFAPIFGFSWPPIAIIMPNFCAMHPLFDGAVVLLNVTEYRKSLFQCVLCTKIVEKPQTTSAVSFSLASKKSTTSVHVI